MTARAILRFAPSPNGRLHLGHAYSALLNQRVAERLGARLLLRIEDLDASRCKLEYETAIVDDLAWLGLVFEAPYRRQSAHAHDYSNALDALRRRGLAYPCLCSRSDVAAMARGAHDPDGAPRHGPRACRLTQAETERRVAAGASPAWRLDVVAASRGDAVWRECFEGEVAFERRGDALAWGDVLLTGRERAASYHLAVVVDDALQGVSDVLRGRDLLEATAVHRVLQDALGLPQPTYRHHRLVLGEDGAKYSKSRGSLALCDLRARGVSPADARTMLGFGDGPPSVRLSEDGESAFPKS